MMKIYYLLYILILSIFLASTEYPNMYIPTFCYNEKYKGFRLNTTIFSTTHGSHQLYCLIVCDKEPCCRSINFKTIWSTHDDQNCELLHNLVYNKSEKLLETNASYNHLYFTSSEKEYNASCLNIDPLGKSAILANETAELKNQLEKWLPKKGEWKICWQASKDGWESSTFHSKCDGKIPTLVIIKVMKDDKNLIFGGYCPVTWAGDDRVSLSPGSFLFSLRNNDNLPPFKAQMKDSRNDYGINRRDIYGPTFRRDLVIADNAGLNNDSYSNFSYAYHAPSGYGYKEIKTLSLLAGSHKFTPSEIEVLYLD